nr:hypothetical protein [Candidatus Krumholzibacteria bacterium]
MRRCVLCGLIMAVAQSGLAADTLETWDHGAGNFEMYSGFGGLGNDAESQSVDSSLLIGWGVADRFSSYLSTSLSSNGYLTSAESELNLGAFGTLHDSDHLDFDLGLDMIVSGPGMTEASVVPAFEINLDRTPDLGSYGLYLRGAAILAGAQYGEDELRRHVDLGLTVGTYYTLSAHQQVLLEYDITVHDEPEPGIPDVERGALALGYNALLHDNLELISEARLNIPQGDEDVEFGFTLGIIATLSAGSR